MLLSLKKPKSGPKTYRKMSRMTGTYVLLAIVIGVGMGACALLAQRVGAYLLSNSNDPVIGQAISTQLDTVPEQPKPSRRSVTTGSGSGGSSKSSSGKTTAKSSSPHKTATSTAKKHSSSSPSTKPKTDIASESSCPGQSQVSKTATVLVCMTSYARKYHNIGGVSANSHLMNSAAAKAADIKDCGFSHTACGRVFNYWFSVKGYGGNCQAENIAQGQETPGEVFKAWMNSTDHRANILNATYHDLGVAELSTPSGTVWVMHLGGC
jgi:uncharacterized protein YkwD